MNCKLALGAQAISTTCGTMLKTFLHVSSQRSLKKELSLLVFKTIIDLAKSSGWALNCIFNVAGFIFNEGSLPLSLFLYFQLGSKLEGELCCAKMSSF